MRNRLLLFLALALVLTSGIVAAGPGRLEGADVTATGELTARITHEIRPVSSRLDGEQLTSVLMTEDFEGAWPGDWVLVDQSDSDGGQYLLGARTCSPHTGAKAGMCAGGGTHGATRDCDDLYPHNADSWAVRGPYDLSNATEAELVFYVYGQSEHSGGETCTEDFMFVGASTNGTDFDGAGVCGDWTGGGSANGHWHLSLDLADWLGEEQVWVAFRFASDASGAFFGLVVDDIAFEATVAGATPTTTPPFQPTATRTTEPTPTRTPDDGTYRMGLPLTLKPIPRTSTVERFTSTNGGQITTATGFGLSIPPEAVPFRTDGSDYEVAFSVETGGDPPAAMPDWVQRTGTTAHFGPDGFSFAYPIDMKLPIPPVTDLTQLSMLRYDEASTSWVREPMAFSGNTITTVSTAGYSLGHRAVVVSPTGPETQLAGEGLDDAMFWYDGAIHMPDASSTHAHGLGWLTGRRVHYYLVVKACTPKIAWQTGLPVGTVLRTGSKPDSSPADDQVWFLQQGTYDFCITAMEWLPPPMEGARKFTYADWVRIVVDEPAHNTCQVSPCWTGDVEFPDLNPDKWSEAPNPCAKNSSATEPVGTGEFQATLTWTNTDTAFAEMDLHLYMPTGDHIYWSNFSSSDGSIKLDRDRRYWDRGACIENIYSVAAMPSGSYTIKVHNYQYSGTTTHPKSYTVRTIHGSTIKTHSGHLEVDEWATIETFTK